MAAIVSQVLGQLGSIVTDELKQRGRLVLGAEKDVQKLTSTFTAIEALLLDAEERQLNSASIENWLKKLKDVSYEIDDVLDEWRTEILKRQLEGDDDAAAYGCLELKLLQISCVLKRVCPFLPAYCFSTGEIGLRYDIASKIKSLNEDLEYIDKEKNMYNFTPRETTSYSSLQTSPNVNFSEVKGRKKEIKILLDKLLDDGSDHPGVRRMSIQGPGGFGKTTLAKMLYNDKTVEAHFDKRVWVCVSNNFDPAIVAKVILESFNQSTSGSLSYMLERINRQVTNKKIFLVFDDVWEDSQSKWEELITSVSSGLPGSMILVTTRKEEVSRVLGCIDDDILHIKKISEDVCRAIFMQIAFNGWRVDEKERVEKLCGRAVKKCSGSPLAAKVLGGVLCLKRSKRDWIQLLGSEMWQMKQGREEVFAPLALSFYDLPPAVRQCFQFCAIYPQDYKMDKDELIRLWKSQGFLKATTNQDVEEVGKEYFQMLVMRSFFQDLETYEKWDGAITCCKMHDLVHDFAQLTTKNECVNILKQETNSSLLSTSKEVRHLMVEHLSEETNKLIASIGCSVLSSAKGSNHLRSFIAIRGCAIEPYAYAHLRCIRSLVLVRCNIVEIPATIAYLIHLRLLDLSHNMCLETLPEEICELYNLETLVLNRCIDLLMLPCGMGNKLISLKHIENYLVPAVLPRSMIRIADSLKTVTTFTVDYAGERGVRSTNIGDLECMNHLQGSLTIRGLSKVTSCEEMKRAALVKKKSLTSLLLDYRLTGIRCFFQKQSDQKVEQVLEAIRPSSNLEVLVIESYQGGSLFPSWLMSLSNLTSLKFHSCCGVEHLPPLGALPSLEELYLGSMDKVNKVGMEFLFESSTVREQQLGMMSSNNRGRDHIIAFPKLTRLCFERMENWQVWDLESDDEEGGMTSSTATVMPRLRCLELYRCEKLDKVPNVLLRRTTLERLVMKESGGLGSYRFDRSHPKMVPDEVWDEISHIPTIVFDGIDIRTRFKSETTESICSSSQEEGRADDDDDDDDDEGKRQEERTQPLSRLERWRKAALVFNARPRRRAGWIDEIEPAELRRRY